MSDDLQFDVGVLHAAIRHSLANPSCQRDARPVLASRPQLHATEAQFCDHCCVVLSGDMRLILLSLRCRLLLKPHTPDGHSPAWWKQQQRCKVSCLEGMHVAETATSSNCGCQSNTVPAQVS